MSRTWPAYLELYESGELARRVEEAVASLASCRVCPRDCKVDRLANETRVCHTGRLARVSSAFPHFGEEDCLRGTQGSGTIFFAYCNLKCVFCFHPDTFVATAKGLTPIADLFKACSKREARGGGLVATAPTGTRVFTRSGAADVARVFEHAFQGELVSLKPLSCPALLLTPNHEVFAAHRSDLSSLAKLRADEVTKDHYLVVPKRSVANEEVTLDTAEVLAREPSSLQRRQRRRVAIERIVSVLRSGRRSAEIGRELGYHPAYVRTLRTKLRRGTLDVPDQVEAAILQEGGRVRYRGEVRPGIPATLGLTPDLAWLLGMYCAEGHVTRIQNRPNSYRLVFSHGLHERKLAERTARLLKEIFGHEPTFCERRTTVSVELGKSSVAVFFKALCGSGAKVKRVPAELLRAAEPTLRAFLDGYLAGDGHDTQTHRVATTVSRTLANGIFELGLHLNVLPSLHESRPPPRTTIEGRDVCQSTLYFMKLKMDRLAGVPDPRERTKWKERDGHFLVPVHRIKRVPYEGPVYNLEVADADHAYLAPFLAVSNCQNHDTSQAGEGREVTAEELAATMLSLQAQGCHNINLVTPEHVVPQVLEGLLVAAGQGLRLPLVYNTSGYDSLESLRWLDGVVDIYMPDFKLWSANLCARYLKAKDYRAVTCDVLREMHRQVGALELDDAGLARCGVLVRHLVMPGLLAESEQIFRFLCEEVSPETYVNVMGQYRPEYKAGDYPEINRRPTDEEMRAARRLFRESGLTRCDRRHPGGMFRLG